MWCADWAPEQVAEVEFRRPRATNQLNDSSQLRVLHLQAFLVTAVVQLPTGTQYQVKSHTHNRETETETETGVGSKRF